MSDTKYYDVLAFIEHKQICYAGSETVKGELLSDYLRNRREIPKELLYTWLRMLLTQLGNYHRCRDHPCYRYLSPFSIVVAKNKELYLLDIQTENNRELVRRMEKRPIRESFLPADQPYYQCASVSTDVYSFGKTWQYILSEAVIVPQLTRREEKSFRAFLLRCLRQYVKNPVESTSELQGKLPKYKEKKKRSGKDVLKIAALFVSSAALLTLLSPGKGSISSGKSNKNIYKNENSVAEEGEGKGEREDKAGEQEEYPQVEITVEEKASETVTLNLELGSLYFLEEKDYVRSKEYFLQAGNTTVTRALARVAECLSEDVLPQESLRDALSQAEKTGELESMKVEQPIREACLQCVLQGYTYLQGEEDARAILRIGEASLGEDAKYRSKTLEAMGYACEILKDPEKAGQMYRELLETEEDDGKRQELYKKIGSLDRELEAYGKAEELLEKGMEEYPQNQEIALLYAGAVLSDRGLDDTLKNQELSELIEKQKYLQEAEEFRKLLGEHGRKIEGGTVCTEQVE